MSTLKTLPNNNNPKKFINSIDNQTRRKDSFVLLELFTKLTGEKPKMWGTSIVGYGMYHYKSAKSRQEGDWPLVGFSPRKQNLTLYLGRYEKYPDLLKKLGKHKISVACLYINKLDDVDRGVLEQIITRAYHLAKEELVHD